METSRFRKTRTESDQTDLEAQVAALTADLRAANDHRRRLELEIHQLKSANVPIDQAGSEVASVLRAFAQTVESAKTDAEEQARRTLEEADAAAAEIRRSAEEDAHRLRVAAQDAHDQGIQGLEVARVEARRVWEETRAKADAILDEARTEAATITDQARASADDTMAAAESKASRVLADAQAATGELRRAAEVDAAKLRADAQKHYEDSTAALEGARAEARRLLDDARHRAETAAAESEARAAARVTAIFTSARTELQKLQEARIAALRTLEVSEERVREVSRSLRTLGELELSLLSVEVGESTFGGYAPTSTEGDAALGGASGEASQSAIVGAPDSKGFGAAGSSPESATTSIPAASPSSSSPSSWSAPAGGTTSAPGSSDAAGAGAQIDGGGGGGSSDDVTPDPPLPMSELPPPPPLPSRSPFSRPDEGVDDSD
jgi:F0F1-type ATP synthase membrane subunit b/b'